MLCPVAAFLQGEPFAGVVQVPGPIPRRRQHDHQPHCTAHRGHLRPPQAGHHRKGRVREGEVRLLLF
jgi:hypothetical protein